MQSCGLEGDDSNNMAGRVSQTDAMTAQSCCSAGNGSETITMTTSVAAAVIKTLIAVASSRLMA